MSVDPELIALLEAVPNLNVYDGHVTADETAKEISVPLPFVVYYSSLGYDVDERLGGRAGGRVTQFQVTYVGSTREQAQWAGEKARAALSRKRVTVSGTESSLIMLRDSATVRRDDDYTRPGGDPLFYGVDQYEVAL